MDTTEHTALGDAMNFSDWETLKHNPYLKIDNKGTLHITMQRINDSGIPKPLNLRLTAGNIIAMSGDYFGGREVDLKLPSINDYDIKNSDFDFGGCESLGDYLIRKPISTTEEKTFINSYKRLTSAW